MDERLRNLERLARAGDLQAQEALERWRQRLYPQCGCSQARLLDKGCKCGYGPERPIFDLETVLRKAGWRVYLLTNDEGFEAWNEGLCFLANPNMHSLRIGFAEGFDRWSVDTELEVDFPYTWDDWDLIMQQMRDLGLEFGENDTD